MFPPFLIAFFSIDLRVNSKFSWSLYYIELGFFEDINSTLVTSFPLSLSRGWKTVGFGSSTFSVPFWKSEKKNTKKLKKIKKMLKLTIFKLWFSNILIKPCLCFLRISICTLYLKRSHLSFEWLGRFTLFLQVFKSLVYFLLFVNVEH